MDRTLCREFFSPLRGACDRPKCASSVVTHMNNQRDITKIGDPSGKWHEAQKRWAAHRTTPVHLTLATDLWHEPTAGAASVRWRVVCRIYCLKIFYSAEDLFSPENLLRLCECGLCRWLPVVVRKIIFSLCFVLYSTPISVAVATQKGSRGCQSVGCPRGNIALEWKLMCMKSFNCASSWGWSCSCTWHGSSSNWGTC